MAFHAADFEKLGSFYLGRPVDPENGAKGETPFLYDSNDLTTHAVCVGMTGSGKTGLGIALLEEAAIDGIPALIIDPKGDLANLALQFPNLEPSDFRPWISGDEAARAGMTPDQFAAAQAESWRDGLARWGEDGERIRKLRESAEVAVFTPGSTAGIPVSVIDSFEVPAQAILDDSELLSGQIETAVASLLGLAGLAVDPNRSREGALLAGILRDAWERREALTLADLARRVQKPPFSQVGVLDLESFYPEKDRFQLLLALNSLLASPGFEIWRQGVPLDLQELLYTKQGRPRLAVFSIAHLSDAERMFFVSMLLGATLSWMRRQAGTTSLRALLYMDEVFGYFPPTANPPSKKPLLTLMKQARAFGLGVVLATQNPADLDYKGLSNAGTWFIGRLQTERDKLRLLDGLGGMGIDRAKIDRMLGGLGKRIFLMNNVHESEPLLFESRWALSYLCGPLTRDQIRKLPRPGGLDAPAPRTAAAVEGGAPIPDEGVTASPPVAENVKQVYPVRAAGGVLSPALIGAATVRFRDAKAKIDLTREIAVAAPFPTALEGVDWNAAEPVAIGDFGTEPPAAGSVSWGEVPAEALRARSYETWKKDFAAWIAESQKLRLLQCPETGLFSGPDEPERDFRVRLGQASREERDARIAALRQKFARQAEAIERRLASAQEAVRVQEAQAGQARVHTVLNLGSTLLGLFLGRKAMSASNLSRATTAAKGFGRSVKESDDVEAARARLEELTKERTALEETLRREIETVTGQLDPLTRPLAAREIAAARTGSRVKWMALGWLPA